MPIILNDLKTREIDYLLASVKGGELVLEPFCSCGAALDENYHCHRCGKVCECNFVACADPRALGVVEKLIAGNPRFRNYKASLLME